MFFRIKITNYCILPFAILLTTFSPSKCKKEIGVIVYLDITGMNEEIGVLSVDGHDTVTVSKVDGIYVPKLRKNTYLIIKAETNTFIIPKFLEKLSSSRVAEVMVNSNEDSDCYSIKAFKGDVIYIYPTKGCNSGSKNEIIVKNLYVGYDDAFKVYKTSTNNRLDSVLSSYGLPSNAILMKHN